MVFRNSVTYLKAQLQGDAAQVISGFILTNANSVTLLKNHYGQPHKVMSTHMQVFLDLPNPSNALTSLQLFHSSVEDT